MQRSPGTYTQGTIYGQIGTSQIAGVGTNWMVDDGSGQIVSAVAQYDELVLPGRRPIQVLSIDDDQHITLGEPLPFGIPAGSAYVIVKRTVSPTTGTLGALQKMAQVGTSAAPRPYEAFGNGVSAFQLGFADDGRIELKVGAAGADGSAQNPWRSALLIDPATGKVSAVGLEAGGDGQAATFNKIWYIPGRPQNSIGIDGDLNIDFLTGFVIYGPKANGTWPAGLDVLAQVSAAAESATEAATSAGQAAQSLQTMQQSITAATQTAVDGVTANVRQNLATAIAEAGSLVAQLQGRVFDFSLAIDPQTQVYAGGFDWSSNV